MSRTNHLLLICSDKDRLDQELSASEDHEAYERGADADERGPVLRRLLPLVKEHHHEKGSHDELDAGGVKVDHAAKQSAQGGTGDPVDLV